MFAGNGFVVTPRVKTPRMTTEKESETLSLRLSKADKAMLDELVEAGIDSSEIVFAIIK